MSRTVTALFDTRADAEAGRERLQAANCDISNVHIHDQSSMSSSSMGQSDTTTMGGTSSGQMSGSTSAYGTTGYSTSQEPGMWASIKNAFLPDEDRHTYEEGIRRGGFLLTADVDEDQVDAAVRVLEDANGVDMDERTSQWRSSGWEAPAAGATTGALFGGQDRDMDKNRAMGSSNEEVIPVIEEQLVVGKRETERGGVRVRSYVTEKPMHEQVRLRQEHVDVQRRNVDQPLSSVEGDAFRERTIEMTETNEEAVVSKNARVVEEVVVSKTAGERVEDINENVRRTDVEVEQLNDTTRGTTGMSGTTDRMSGTTGSTGSTGSTLGGLGNEAIGNVKQGLGSVTGIESLERSGEAQERRGESQQGKTPGS